MFAPIGMVAFAKISSHLITKGGEIGLMVIGLFIMLSSLGCFSWIEATWGSYIFIFLLLLYGIGAGLFQTPNLLITMKQALHSQQASVGAFLRMLQNMGFSLASAVSAMLIASNSEQLILGIKQGWQLTFIMMLCATVCGTIVFILHKKKF